MTVGWAGSHLGLDWGFWIIAAVTMLGAVITKVYLSEEKPIAQVTSC
jgi:hypothetical protein